MSRRDYYRINAVDDVEEVEERRCVSGYGFWTVVIVVIFFIIMIIILVLIYYKATTIENTANSIKNEVVPFVQRVEQDYDTAISYLTTEIPLIIGEVKSDLADAKEVMDNVNGKVNAVFGGLCGASILGISACQALNLCDACTQNGTPCSTTCPSSSNSPVPPINNTQQITSPTSVNSSQSAPLTATPAILRPQSQTRPQPQSQVRIQRRNQVRPQIATQQRTQGINPRAIDTTNVIPRNQVYQTSFGLTPRPTVACQTQGMTQIPQYQNTGMYQNPYSGTYQPQNPNYRYDPYQNQGQNYGYNSGYYNEIASDENRIIDNMDY